MNDLVRIGVFVILIAIHSGCTSSDSARPNTDFAKIHRDRLTLYQQHVLWEAEVDFHRALAGRSPRYAVLGQSLRDGGSKLYKGRGYTLMIYNSIATLGGKHGLTVGAGLSIPDILVDGKPLSFEQTQFKAVDWKQ